MRVAFMRTADESHTQEYAGLYGTVCCLFAPVDAGLQELQWWANAR